MNPAPVTVHSSDLKNAMMGGAALTVGTLLMILGNHNAAASCLGAVILLLGACIAVFFESILITALPQQQSLFISTKSICGFHTKLILFSDVKGVAITTITGDKNRTATYLLSLMLKNGKVQPTGYTAGDWDDVSTLAQALATAIGCPVHVPAAPRALPITTGLQVLLAALMAFIIYVVWYRITTGQLCHAMWFGTAPILVMGLSFLMGFRVLRRLTAS